MKIFMYFILAFTCLINWICVAYRPFSNLFGKKSIKIGSERVYRTISGLLKASSFQKINVLTRTDDTHTPNPQDKSVLPNIKTNFFGFLKIDRESQKKNDPNNGILRYDSIDYNNYCLLLETIQKNAQKSSFRSGGIAGFMEFDPKSAATKQYKNHSVHKGRGLTSWLSL